MLLIAQEATARQAEQTLAAEKALVAERELKVVVETARTERIAVEAALEVKKRINEVNEERNRAAERKVCLNHLNLNQPPQPPSNSTSLNHLNHLNHLNLNPIPSLVYSIQYHRFLIVPPSPSPFPSPFPLSIVYNDVALINYNPIN